MPNATELGPSPDAGRCTGCGRPLGGGPWWVLDGGRFHEPCAPWQARPYPLTDELKRLRALRRRLVLAVRAVDAAGVALREAERRWPHEALAILSDGRARLEALEQRLRELGVRR